MTETCSTSCSPTPAPRHRPGYSALPTGGETGSVRKHCGCNSPANTHRSARYRDCRTRLLFGSHSLRPTNTPRCRQGPYSHCRRRGTGQGTRSRSCHSLLTAGHYSCLLSNSGTGGPSETGWNRQCCDWRNDLRSHNSLTAKGATCKSDILTMSMPEQAVTRAIAWMSYWAGEIASSVQRA